METTAVHNFGSTEAPQNVDWTWWFVLGLIAHRLTCRRLVIRLLSSTSRRTMYVSKRIGIWVVVVEEDMMVTVWVWISV